MQKRYSIDANTKMTEILDLSDKDFKAANDEIASTATVNVVETFFLKQASAKKQELYKRTKWKFQNRKIQ